MKSKRMCMALAFLLGAGTLLSGCGISSGQKGTLTVGVRDDIVNFGFQNKETGRYFGLEIDIAEEMAKRMGYSKVEYVTVVPDDRKEVLLEGDVDCLVACYSIADSRLENFDFSPAYYTDTTDIMLKNSSLITSLEEMQDMTIGIMSGSNAGPLLANKLYEMGMITDVVVSNTDEGTEYEGMHVKKFESYQAVSDALEEGVVDGACMDGSIANTYMNEERTILGINIAEQNYGVATQKGSELSQPVADTIQEMLDDGTIETMIDKWD